MAGTAEMLRATEAAVVSGAPLREVNRAIDERILPSDLYSVGPNRLFSPSACVMIAFYHASADDLTKTKRLDIIGKIEPRLRHRTFHDLRSSRENWRLTDGFVTIDFAPFVARALDRFEQLREAKAMVTCTPDVMGGASVIRGTRVPVHDVGASVKAGHRIERIREAYPSLSDRQIALAALYAEANPPMGRPRTPSPSEMLKVSERRTKRRGEADEAPRR